MRENKPHSISGNSNFCSDPKLQALLYHHCSKEALYYSPPAVLDLAAWMSSTKRSMAPKHSSSTALAPVLHGWLGWQSERTQLSIRQPPSCFWPSSHWVPSLKEEKWATPTRTAVSRNKKVVHCLCEDTIFCKPLIDSYRVPVDCAGSSRAPPINPATVPATSHVSCHARDWSITWAVGAHRTSIRTSPACAGPSIAWCVASTPRCDSAALSTTSTSAGPSIHRDSPCQPVVDRQEDNLLAALRVSGKTFSHCSRSPVVEQPNGVLTNRPRHTDRLTLPGKQATLSRKKSEYCIFSILFFSEFWTQMKSVDNE